MPTSKQRIHKSTEDKLLIVSRVEKGMSHQAVAKEFGISRTAVTKMIKEKDILVVKLEKSKLRKKRSNGACFNESHSDSPQDSTFSIPETKPAKNDVKNLINAVKVLSDAECTSEQNDTTEKPRRTRILLGASGSVATVKLPELAIQLSTSADVRIIVTKASMQFLEKAEKYNPDMYKKFQSLKITIYKDEDEWSQWNSMGDSVLHIELREWADIYCIAPLSANTMGKLSYGLCDNLLTCVARAWSFQKPIVIAPAMNTQMYLHPATGNQLAILREFGYDIIPPVSKTLACGEIGNGALAMVDTIVSRIHNALRV